MQNFKNNIIYLDSITKFQPNNNIIINTHDNNKQNINIIINSFNIKTYKENKYTYKFFHNWGIFKFMTMY